MIVGGQRFPDTAAGYRYAARHVYKLGPTFHEDAYGLNREASRLEIEARFKRRASVTLVAFVVAVSAWHAWNWVQ